MYLSTKGTQSKELKLKTANKLKTLNPNAAEFVPSALKSSSPGSSSTDVAGSRFAPCGGLAKAVLGRSESAISNNSDEEAHHYWRSQLPDDITPDFKAGVEDGTQSLGNLSLSGLSLNDDTGASQFSAPAQGGYLFDARREISTDRLYGNHNMEKLRFSASHYGDDLSSARLAHIPATPWETAVLSGIQLVGKGPEVVHSNINSRQGFVMDMSAGHEIVDEGEMNPLEFLGVQFPGFAAESLAEIYFANGGDLNLTFEMLTQLELQVDGGLNQIPDSKSYSEPNLSAMNFQQPNLADSQSGHKVSVIDDFQRGDRLYQPSVPFRGAIDFASAVRKLASPDSGIWKHNRNSSADSSIGTSRISQAVANNMSASGHARAIYGNRFQSRGLARAAPVWLETGDAIANVYSEQREEAHEHAHLQNAYFEQARQAYLLGNKALAKELSVKGQLHNVKMKAAHEKAQESIYRQRNTVAPELQGNGNGRERIIDLHGLHVGEAIHMLKHELGLLRSAARAAEQRLQVYICVGTGHHTRGSRTPTRLPVAVQRHLLEEGLDYTEPLPGLLRVIIF